jgi:asparagine synthase (glutamine-hydrolysing)
MVEALAHRGPDDRDVLSIGAATLGHTRLSILDLSPAGHQPMHTEDGRYWLSFNGEIYNFASLKTELEAKGVRFRSTSDTEVLLAGYVAWGHRVFARLNGIWAVALWDARDEELVLSRDRFGVKPLYVVESANTLAFASEIKALLTLPWVSAEPDEAAVGQYLLAGIVDESDGTFLRGIRRVAAATFESHRRGDSIHQRYWEPRGLSDDSSYGPQAGDDALVDRFRDTFLRAVERQLQSDVPIGSCLSGGLDSSSIVSAASALRHRSTAGGGPAGLSRIEFPHLGFFARFTGAALDEYRFARTVADSTATDLRVITPDVEAFLSALVPTVRAQDEPFGSASIVAQYLVMSLAREAGVKVLLDGQGGDELLGGYPVYIGDRLMGADLARNPRLVASAMRSLVVGEIPVHLVLSRAKRVLRSKLGAPQPSRLAAFAGPRAAAAPPTRNDYAVLPGSVLSRALWQDIVCDSLPALLRYEDRNSMAFAIEARVPFLDHELVDLALLLPDRLKVDPGTTKSVLRRAMRGLVADEVLERKDKMGFQPPQDAWLRAALPRLRPLARSSCAEEMGFVRAGGVGGILDAFGARHLHHDQAWRVINLELWLRLLQGKDPLSA